MLVSQKGGSSKSFFLSTVDASMYEMLLFVVVVFGSRKKMIGSVSTRLYIVRVEVRRINTDASLAFDK